MPASCLPDDYDGLSGEMAAPPDPLRVVEHMHLSPSPRGVKVELIGKRRTSVLRRPIEWWYRITEGPKYWNVTIEKQPSGYFGIRPLPLLVPLYTRGLYTGNVSSLAGVSFLADYGSQEEALAAALAFILTGESTP